MTATEATTERIFAVQGSRLCSIDDLDLEAGEFKNPRTFTGLATSDIRDFAGGILAHSLKDPLKVRRYKVGEPAVVRNLVTDGQRRTLAIRYLVETGHLAPGVLVPVVDEVDMASQLGPEESLMAFEESLIVGSQRAPLSTFEQIEAAVKLATGKPRRSQKEIASVLGRSETWISRMVTAWKTSTHELRESLKTGTITDEQFKELAVVKPAEQAKVVADVVETRAKGERREARDMSKKAAAEHRPEPKPRKNAATAAKKLAAAPAPSLPPARAMVSRDVTSGEIMAMAKLVPPVDQYMKGVVDMARCVTGEMTTEKLGKPFRLWIERVKKKMVGAGAKAAKQTKPAAVKPVAKVTGRASSQACAASHHARCKEMQKEGKNAGCACACHGGK